MPTWIFYVYKPFKNTLLVEMKDFEAPVFN